MVPILALALSAPAAAATPSIVNVPAKTVKAGQGRIGYRSVGTGRPLVMIMGLSGTMDAWAPAFVDELAKHRRVIVFDNEGIRKTTLGKGTLSIRRMGDDTASLIRALKLKRPDVLGWSMGGMIAQSLARRHPELVRRLVLCATAPGDRHATGPSGPGMLDALANPEANPAALLGLIFPPGQDAAIDRVRDRHQLVSEGDADRSRRDRPSSSSRPARRGCSARSRRRIRSRS